MDAFAVSTTAEGLCQARYPSHIPQVIPGFALFWVLQVCDHHLFFADSSYARDLFPIVDRIFAFFRGLVDARGLLSGVPGKYWQFVDWAESWEGTPAHPEGGVPTAGRATNTHTFASLLLAYTAQAVARLAADFGHHTARESYAALARRLVTAVQTYCFDGEYFLDTTKDVAGPGAHSQHVQVFAVLAQAASGPVARRIVLESARSPSFAKCSYVFMHYAFRAYAQTGLYEELWHESWSPWRRMLADNLTTWEEDPVTKRSDCHAWGSVAIYEYLVEVAGVHPTACGWREIRFEPRVALLPRMSCNVALGDNMKTASVRWEWEGSSCRAVMDLSVPLRVWTRDIGGALVDRGVAESVCLDLSR
jgi:hypothetical protein